MGGPRYTDLALYRRLLGLARPYWLHILGLFVISLVSSPLALLTPVPLKIAVDSVLGDHAVPRFVETLVPAFAIQSKTSVLLLAVGLMVGVALVRQLQQMGVSMLRTYTGNKLVQDFRAQLVRHVQRLSLAYHDTKGTADSVYRIQWDAPAIQYIAIDNVIPLITAAVMLVSMLYVVLELDWQLTMIALSVSPILLLLTGAFRPRLRKRYREIKTIESSTLGVVQEVLGALRVVKAFGQEDREEQRFVRRSAENLRARLRLAVAEGGLDLLVGVTVALGSATALFVGVRHVQSETLTLGNLLLVLGYLTQLYGPLTTISSSVATLQGHLASAERAFALLDEMTDVVERPDARPLGRASGVVTFDNVSFAYGSDRPALRDLSFSVTPGTRVGVVGATGAGKTTLVNLLTRLYDPTRGRILLDGIDLREYRLTDLRAQFAIVLQEPVLFSTSVAENIAYARPGASDEEIVAAARAANAHDFITKLPQGYDTLVGERGMRLSGGERQRIALARAFLKDAPILILDEPTSSVDVKTEEGIIAAMRHLMRDRTTFMIAHRLTTLADCDVRLTIDDGELVAMTSEGAAIVGDESTVEERVAAVRVSGGNGG